MLESDTTAQYVECVRSHHILYDVHKVQTGNKFLSLKKTAQRSQVQSTLCNVYLAAMDTYPQAKLGHRLTYMAKPPFICFRLRANLIWGIETWLGLFVDQTAPYKAMSFTRLVLQSTHNYADIRYLLNHCYPIFKKG